MMEKANTKKRNTLKKLAIGTTVGSAPFIWSKPILNSIMLPAHAQTSAQILSELVGDWEGTFTESGRIFGFTIFSNGLINLRDVVVGLPSEITTEERDNPSGSCTDIFEITPSSDGTFRIRPITFNCGPSFFSGEFNPSTDRIEGLLIENAFSNPGDLFVAQRV